MIARSTRAALFLSIVVGILLYMVAVLDLGPVLITFDDGHGIHLADVAVLLLALPVLIRCGKRLTGGTK